LKEFEIGGGVIPRRFFCVFFKSCGKALDLGIIPRFRVVAVKIIRK